ncbi:MAG: hypothetical protein ACMXYF_00420 [Candidatus Woesearchaeota archaeon]
MELRQRPENELAQQLNNLNTPVVRMDYKIHLASQYISTRIHQLGQAKTEVGFIYGGNVTHKRHQTIIDINDIHLATKQTITPTTYDIPASQVQEALNYFQSKKKRITGVGHSHSTFDTFHSQTDFRAHQQFMQYAIKMRSTAKPNIPESFQKTPILRTITSAITKLYQTPKYVLPSIVYNAKADPIHSELAVQDRTFRYEPMKIEFYNKNAVLSDGEKQELDFKIRKILKYNNIPLTHSEAHPRVFAKKPGTPAKIRPLSPTPH